MPNVGQAVGNKPIMKSLMSAILPRISVYANVAKTLSLAMALIFATVSPQTIQAKAQTILDVRAIASSQTETSFPTASNREAPRTTKISVTAYNSVPWQTDDTPFNTADGTHVRDGIVAANFLPLGTRVKFPEIYGDKEFVVKDRMNARYRNRADIWMESIPDAKQFGHNYTTIEIY